MKILNLILAASSVFAAVAASDVLADSPVYFKPEVAYVLPTKGDVDDTFFVGGRLGYDLDESWALELESGWMEYGWDPSENITNIDVTTVPVLLNVRWGHRCSPEELGWYVFLGAGYAFNSLDDDDDRDLDLEGSVAWQGGGGVEVNVAKGLDIFVDARYLWNKADFDHPDQGLEDRLPDNLDLSSVLFSTGVRF